MQIEIPEPLLKRLQKHATPFVDTPVHVIERWADFYEQHNQQKTDFKAEYETTKSKPTLIEIPDGVRQFDPKRPPSLLHTRVCGEFATMAFSNWNDLLRTAHIHAFKEARSFEELRKITRAQIRKGSYSHEGYKFVPEIDISIQGVDADHAWPYALRLAVHLKVPVKAEIEWRNNDKAAHPGERGVMVWTP
jgi:hypothetical protein